MTYHIIDKNTIEIDKYVINILDLIGSVVDKDGIITGIYNIQLFENNKELYKNNVCLKITRRKINLDDYIVDIINKNDNFTKIIYYDDHHNTLTDDFLNFKKDTDVYFMIMEKIDNTFHDLCSNLETENFHLSADMLNYFTYTLINSMIYLLQNNLCYFDLKPLNIGYKIINNKFIIKIIDIDSIAYINSDKGITHTNYTSPYYLKKYHYFNVQEAQLDVILFTIFQLLFNDKDYNACKDYYTYLQDFYTNTFIDPNVDYSISCSNLKTIIIAYINKLIFYNLNLNYNDFLKNYGNNIEIEDEKLKEYLNNLFYFAYKFKQDNSFNDISLFNIGHDVTIENAYELGNSKDIGSEIIAKIIYYINTRNLQTYLIKTNSYINIQTMLIPTIVENITIQYLNKIDDNKYFVNFIDNINDHTSKFYMSLEKIDNSTMNFIKSKKYFNNIIYSIWLDKLTVLDTEYTNVYLIISKKLINDRTTTYNNSSILNIIKSIVKILNDLNNNGYYYDLDINNVYIKHNKVQLIDYTKLTKIKPGERIIDQLLNMYDLLLSIITKNVRQSQDYSLPNDELITKLIQLNYFDKNKINKLNYILFSNVELRRILNTVYKDIFQEE